MNDAKTDPKAKQQIVDMIKSSTNILVTVSNSPSVDALSAALGLTIMLNELGKHATAIFSGEVPPAITFLDSTKTFTNTIDSLRDFIIALDKEKADHLRYKVDGDVVKIFITPYKTTLTSDDLEFSQGDYNVELVLALGVDNPEHLDKALEAHGQILHDATVATVGTSQPSQLGSIDWTNSGASSLSEMVASLADVIKADKSLLDTQTSTALLTGIVAATDRFSNNHTTPSVMTIAAQLMAAGADQQLIAAKLQEGHAIAAAPAATDTPVAPTDTSNNFSIAHTEPETTAPIETSPTPVAPPSEPPTPSITPLSDQTTGLPDVAVNDVPIGPVVLADAYKVEPGDETTEAEPSSHDYLGETPTYATPMNATTVPETPIGVLGGSPTPPPIASAPAAASDALAQAHAAIDAQPPVSAAPAMPFNLPSPPPLPDFSTLVPPVSPVAPPTATAPVIDTSTPSVMPPPERLGDIFAPEPPAVTTPPTASDPGQFQIPGQT